jgi:bifunctional DNase/RNase
VSVPVAGRLLVVSVVALGGFTGLACKATRDRSHAPPVAASIASAAEQAAPEAPTLPVGSAIVPSASVFADGGAPNGYERASVWDVIEAGDGAAVLLIDAKHLTVLPIFVGGTEAMTIRLRADGSRYERPLTHDLLSSLVHELGGSPVKSQIDEIRDDTYFGSVFVRQGDRVLQLDARPSDAIAIALGSGAPLYVSRSVMLASGVPREEIEKAEKAQDIEKRRKGNRISL